MIKATNSSDQSIVITGPDFFFFFLVGDPTKSTAQRLLDMFLYQTARINRVLLQTDRPDAGVGLNGLLTTLVRLFGLDCSVCLLILHDSDGRDTVTLLATLPFKAWSNSADPTTVSEKGE